jgi:hypothetical protein
MYLVIKTQLLPIQNLQSYNRKQTEKMLLKLTQRSTKRYLSSRDITNDTKYAIAKKNI